MEMAKMISELRSEREKIDQAIYSLEQLDVASGKKRGRPPKWLAERKARSQQMQPDSVQTSPQMAPPS